MAQLQFQTGQYFTVKSEARRGKNLLPGRRLLTELGQLLSIPQSSFAGILCQSLHKEERVSWEEEVFVYAMRSPKWAIKRC